MYYFWHHEAAFYQTDNWKMIRQMSGSAERPCARRGCCLLVWTDTWYMGVADETPHMTRREEAMEGLVGADLHFFPAQAFATLRNSSSTTECPEAAIVSSRSLWGFSVGLVFRQPLAPWRLAWNAPQRTRRAERPADHRL